jgi:hypothetical protein
LGDIWTRFGAFFTKSLVTLLASVKSRKRLPLVWLPWSASVADYIKAHFSQIFLIFVTGEKQKGPEKFINDSSI